FRDAYPRSAGPGRLHRIDPATKQADSGLALPIAGGRLLASAEAVFYGDVSNDGHWFRLGASDTAFVDLGLLPRDPIAGATGLWAQTIGGAGRFAAPGGPQDTVPIEGNLVAADERAVYASRDTPVADADNLWRYPLDGSAGEPIAAGTTVAGIAGGL